MDIRDMGYALRALSDTARLRILEYLSGYDEITVSELTKALRISQPLASWHLRKLRRAQLIITRREGRQVFCSLNRARLNDTLQSLSQWCDGRSVRVLQSPTSLANPNESPVYQRGGGR